MLCATVAVVAKARLFMKLASFFDIRFYSLCLLYIGLNRAENRNGVEMQMNIEPRRNIWAHI